MEQKEWELLISKELAESNAKMFCLSHGIPEEAIEETENGYRFCIEFKYK